MNDVRCVPGAIHSTGLRLQASPWVGGDCPIQIVPRIPGRINDLVIDQSGKTGDPLTRIIDVNGLVPDCVYDITIPSPFASESPPIVVRTPPADLSQGELDLCLFSCYFPSEEYYANARRARDILRNRQIVPHMKVFAGDQIYADVPWSTENVANIYWRRYREMSQKDRLGSLLNYGANIFTCDDHEFWNGFPESMFWLSRSFDNSWQSTGAEAETQFFRRQGILNFSSAFSGGESDHRCWCAGQISGIDMFVADTRTDRSSRDNIRRSSSNPNTAASTMSPRQLNALLAWIDSVRGCGILVLGQPLWLQTERLDNVLADYFEYDVLLERLARKMEAEDVTFVVLTGDIHWGRLTSLTNPLRPSSQLIEFVSSPIARVAKKNILSRRLGVGERSSVKFSFSDYPGIKKFFHNYQKKLLFATSENNFGRLLLSPPLPGTVRATFELWSLDTQQLALDSWHSRSEPCSRTISF